MRGRSRPIFSPICASPEPRVVNLPSLLEHLARSGVEGPKRLGYMRTHFLNHGTSPAMGRTLPLLGLLGVLALAGCASTGVSVQNAGADQQLAPVQGGDVQTAALPPIGPNGQVQGATDLQGNAPPPLVPNGQGQQATTDSTATLPNSSGRDLTGGLTIEKLLGRWTVVSGTDQCAINLTQTQKGSTGRYRASAPSCALPGIGGVASWQLNGSQIQLYSESGGAIATLILSGNRFIGTLAGGQGISLVG